MRTRDYVFCGYNDGKQTIIASFSGGEDEKIVDRKWNEARLYRDSIQEVDDFNKKYKR